MENQELYKQWHAMSEKFNYALLTLTFAAMALSFQYSPKMGNAWPWLLVASWLSFGLSAVCGGQRITKELVHARLNYTVNHREAFIRQRTADLLDPRFQQQLRAGNALDNMTGIPLTEQSVRANLQEEKEKLKIASKNMEAAAAGGPLLYQIQFWTLMLAFALNGTFVARNYLLGLIR